MKAITYKERKKYGCWFCRDVTHGYTRGTERLTCQHEKCPYRKELAKYGSYEEYIEATGGITNIFDKYLVGGR